MSARMCEECQVAWPSIDWTDKIGKRDVAFKFDRCPACGEETHHLIGISAIDKKEARSKVMHLRFETFYRLWEKAREKRGDMSPEAKGRLEAKEIHELEQALDLDSPERSSAS